MIVREIEKYRHFAIYGAHVVACGAYKAIECLFHRAPDCFIVSFRDGNPEEIEGIPVRALSEVPKDRLILVCVTEIYQDEICAALSESGYRNVLRLTNHEEHLLMSAYYAALGRFPAPDIAAAYPPAELALYEVRSHMDKPLSRHPEPRPFERAIQAGAALVEARIAPLADDTGDNISAKNRQYCEMSAAYWVWKNTDSAWKGIEHYRRHLLVGPEMLGGGIDAVLPLPDVSLPDLYAHFRRFVPEGVVGALELALRTLHPQEYGAYREILDGPFEYSYNMLCARREVFDDYCAWFFRITEYMETLADTVPALSDTRALSYVAERLTTLYFMSHQNDLNIVHAEKEIYT